MHRRSVILSLMGLALSPASVRANSLRQQISDISANVIFMRHALAPGGGDPANFRIDDCKTQRNLSNEGRNQARQIGALFRAGDIQFNQIYTSQWCRCKETAALLDLGPVEEFAGLNSFFQSHADRGETLKLLSNKLKSLKPNELILCVTHQVVIQAVTGNSVGSGQSVAYNSFNQKSRKLSLG